MENSVTKKKLAILLAIFGILVMVISIVVFVSIDRSTVKVDKLEFREIEGYTYNYATITIKNTQNYDQLYTIELKCYDKQGYYVDSRYIHTLVHAKKTETSEHIINSGEKIDRVEYRIMLAKRA